MAIREGGREEIRRARSPLHVTHNVYMKGICSDLEPLAKVDLRNG